MLCTQLDYFEKKNAQKAPIMLKSVSFVEINQKLQDFKNSNNKWASLVTEQLFANAMVSAGLMAYQPLKNIERKIPVKGFVN